MGWIVARQHLFAASGAVLLWAAALGASAQPPVALAWSTYLRTGPGETYEAIAELEHDTPVGVSGCDGRWCRVTTAHASGYVDRDALDLPRTPAPARPVRTDCVTVGQADNRGPIPTRFCSAAPAAAGSAPAAR